MNHSPRTAVVKLVSTLKIHLVLIVYTETETPAVPRGTRIVTTPIQGRDAAELVHTDQRVNHPHVKSRQAVNAMLMLRPVVIPVLLTKLQYPAVITETRVIHV